MSYDLILRGGPALRDDERGLHVINLLAAAGGARRFPPRAPCRITLSNVRSDTALRSRPLSLLEFLQTLDSVELRSRVALRPGRFRGGRSIESRRIGQSLTFRAIFAAGRTFARR